MNAKATINYYSRFFLDGILYSYSQIFFCNKRWFGLCLLILTLINPFKTLIGVSVIILSLAFGILFKFDEDKLRNGIYTYNALLVGLGIASLYEVTLKTILVTIFYSLLSLFLAVVLSNFFGKRGLPSLTLPFLLCIWMVYSSQRAYGEIKFNTDIEHELIFLKPLSEKFSQLIDLLSYKDAVHIFLKSLSAIFFIYNDLVGFCIVMLLVLYSRISFTLAVWGFFIGIMFFNYFLGDYKIFVFDYISFNFILISISLGGFFIVPSLKGYVLQIFTVSLCCILLGAFSPFLYLIKMPVYSLPFVAVVLVVLSALKLRLNTNGIELVKNQQYKPEQNFYKNYYEKLRFKAMTYFHIYLPVMGEWNVSQGINGRITHLDDWKNAWDFDVRNYRGLSYYNTGTQLKDYLCYDLPVIAPCSGYVVMLQDYIEDNEIGKINQLNNWGNSLVIKVAEQFYVQLSHFRAGSFKVSQGDYVKAGQLLGHCGNSGRSPEPHIHFQMQITPDIGSKTIPYPIAYYFSRDEKEELHFNSFSYPKENEKVSNILPDSSLQEAFGFLPNHCIEWEIEKRGKKEKQKWFSAIDAFNRSYLYDEENDSYAYYRNDGVVVYFYDFIGSRSSYLFNFYLASQKILLGNYKNVQIKDWIMPSYVYPASIQWIQDFLAPFIQIFKGKYTSLIINPEKGNSSEIHIRSSIEGKTFGVYHAILQCEMIIRDRKINTVKIVKNNTKTTMKCLRIYA